MTTDFWDDTMNELADILGGAGAIQEAVPFPLAQGTIYARSGSSWSVLSVRTVGTGRILLMAAGLLTDVLISLDVYRDMTTRTAGNAFGAYLAMAKPTDGRGALVFRSSVPYDLLDGTAGTASQLARQIVSATINAPQDLMPELTQAHGGQPFDFEDRGYLANLVI